MVVFFDASKCKGNKFYSYFISLVCQGKYLLKCAMIMVDLQICEYLVILIL